MNFQRKRVILQALTYFKTYLTPTWMHPPVTKAQVKDLAKYTMID